MLQQLQYTHRHPAPLQAHPLTLPLLLFVQFFFFGTRYALFRGRDGGEAAGEGAGAGGGEGAFEIGEV